MVLKNNNIDRLLIMLIGHNSSYYWPNILNVAGSITPIISVSENYLSHISLKNKISGFSIQCVILRNYLNKVNCNFKNVGTYQLGHSGQNDKMSQKLHFIGKRANIPYFT